MKFSKETLAILKNFAQINGNLLIKPGSTLSTISAAAGIFATANVSEKFTEEFGIYDTNEFLAAMSLFTDPDITFTKKVATLKEGKQAIKFYSADASVLKTPPNGVKFPSVDVKFVLSAEHLNMIIKTGGVLRSNDVTFKGEDGTLTAIVGDKTNDTANSYQLDLGETDKEFTAHFNIDNFKFVPAAYDVEFCAKRIARFTSADISYIVVMDAESTFN